MRAQFQEASLHIPSDNGWAVEKVTVTPGSSLALLEFNKAAEAPQRVRLDMDKHMFVDTPPAGVELSGAALIAKAVHKHFNP